MDENVYVVGVMLEDAQHDVSQPYNGNPHYDNEQSLEAKCNQNNDGINNQTTDKNTQHDVSQPYANHHYDTEQNLEMKPNQYNNGVNNQTTDKNCSAVWTTNATVTLLKLYESKMGMLETPKKKTKMWLAISESLKNYDIEMSPDQVRWKINALMKKYKQCIETGKHKSFKYFNEMDGIFGQCTEDDACSVSELMQRKDNAIKSNLNTVNNSTCYTPEVESKALIEIRKVRLANRIEADRSQRKIKLEKQWIDYLKRQEEQKLLKDMIYDRTLKLREEELELRKKELEMRESLELRKIQIKEQEQEEILRIEREKCELLKILAYRK